MESGRNQDRDPDRAWQRERERERNISSRQTAAAHWRLAVHGGAGSAERGRTGRAQEHAVLANALEAGAALLRAGGRSAAAVEAAVRVLEDSPLFNAGCGAVYNAAGENELDASIMDGETLRAGAVAAVQGIRNPVSLARAIMDRGTEVLVTGSGATRLARELGIELADADYFHTEHRWQALEKARAAAGADQPTSGRDFSTVGAVALDTKGHVAAATSTGGLTNKLPGRVGDSAIVGAGTWACDATCAVSATGSGEHLIRVTMARTIAAIVEHEGRSLAEAVRAAMQRLEQLQGLGGVIAISPQGETEFAFNTDIMFRGLIGDDLPRWTGVGRN